LNGCDKTIPELGNRLEKTGLLGSVVQSRANLPDCIVQAMLEIDEGFRAPNAFGNFCPTYDLPRTRSEEDENFGRLGLELDAGSIPAQFSGMEIKLEALEDGNPSGI
jgi:hypothetical protein